MPMTSTAPTATATPRSVASSVLVPERLAPLQRRLHNARVPPFDVQLQDGTAYRLAGGDWAEADTTEARFRLTIRTDNGLRALTDLDELQLGVAYLNGDIDVDGDFLSVLDLRRIFTDRHPARSLMRFVIPLVIGQRRADMSWVPKHYDFGNEFYFAFLDKRYGLYSQALYTSEDESLEDAVENKLSYIVNACRLSAGSRVLDVGGGWGGFEKYIGPQRINSTMLTLSQEQYKFLAGWCRSHGMPADMSVVRESIFTYDAPEKYDAIVLLGVMEHLPDYQRLFATFARLLKPGARVYMDFAANRKKFRVSSFTHKYVFPGNHTPVYLPDLFKGAIRNGFEPIALHNDRHSYYLTLQAWARNLEAARDRLIPMVGERVYRLFQVYLWGGAHLMLRTGALESYRIVWQLASGRPSTEIGVYRAI